MRFRVRRRITLPLTDEQPVVLAGEQAFGNDEPTIVNPAGGVISAEPRACGADSFVSVIV
ncbi:MAG: hypothetical protein E6G46_04745 [Actinobacteria bacterium]|nr:MAG: hypothetical protein E6G46_04745 [Actinomycetota bacterium]